MQEAGAHSYSDKEENMNEEYTLGAKEQEAAEPAGNVESTGEVEGVDSTGEKEQETAEPAQDTKPGKTGADRAFAKLRREKEEQQRQLSRMMEIYKSLGFDGSDPDDAADRAEAHRTGRDVAAVREERQREQSREQEMERQRSELNFLRAQEIRRRMAEDLKAVQKIDPSVKSLADLGGDFAKLIRAGVDAATATRAILAQRESTQAKPPAKAGKVNAKSGAERDYFTNEELDKLTAEELDDPRVMEKAMRSLTRLKK